VNAVALSVLRECHLNLLRASVAAEHAQTLLSGPVRARELVGKVNDALTLIGRLVAGIEGIER
jgi:hypothetical protein